VWVYLLFTSYAGPASRVLPDLISLIFLSRRADAFTQSCGHEMKHIACRCELTFVRPRNGALFNPIGEKQHV
jgi:hypothetical protein